MSKIIKITFLIFILNLIVFNQNINAATIQLPQWYAMNASFEKTPVLGKTVDVNVELKAIIGNLENIKIRLILPDKWQVDYKSKEVKKIESGKSEIIKFKVTPKTELAQGSIVVEGIFDASKNTIIAAIDKIATDKDMALAMKSEINAWPNPTKRYTDINFAIFPEESFYPLSNDMWVNYEDEMAPSKDFKGPVYYSDSMISTHQAQTDVEMYMKLSELLKTDDALASKLTETGIDLNKKRLDYLNGLYVLSVDAWKNQDYQTSLSLLDQLGKELTSLKGSPIDNLKIASGNIKALVYWKQGQKHLAEEAFKNTFAQNRKNKLQRYILRNLGLFMYSIKDKSSAEQMYKLAKDMKNSYTLLDTELSFIK